MVKALAEFTFHHFGTHFLEPRDYDDILLYKNESRLGHTTDQKMVTVQGSPCVHNPLILILIVTGFTRQSLKNTCHMQCHTRHAALLDNSLPDTKQYTSRMKCEETHDTEWVNRPTQMHFQATIPLHSFKERWQNDERTASYLVRSTATFRNTHKKNYGRFKCTYIWAKKRFRTRDLFSFHNTSWFDIFNIFLNPMTKVSFPITLILFQESNSHRTTFRQFQPHCGNSPTPVPQRSPRSSCRHCFLHTP
jgi:hypothetical protein